MKNQFYFSILACILFMFALQETRACSKPNYKYSVLGNKVTFINTSTNMQGNLKIFFRFGDGTLDYTGKDTVIYEYSSPGTYKACIEAYDSNTNFYTCDSTCNYITISGCPKFGYKLLQDEDKITLIDRSVGGFPYYRRWVMMDSSRNILRDTLTTNQSNDSFTHEFRDSGLHYAKLVIYDSAMNVCDSIVRLVNIKKSFYCPTPDFDYKVFGDTVTVYNTTPNGSSYNSRWKFGDGHIDSSNRDTFFHIYSDGGIYNVCLYILDNDNKICDSICKNIEIESCPTVDFEYEYTDYNTITFTNKSTGNLPIRVKWRIAGETPSDFTYDKEYVYNFTSSGTKNVCLIAYEVSSKPCDSICKNVNMKLTCGIAAFDYQINGNEVTFIKQSDGMSPSKLRWDFGDSFDDTSANNDSIVHVYQNFGTYIVTLYTYDSAFQICDSISKVIVIAPPCANADFSFNKLNYNKIEFINQSTGSKPYKILWSFGDSNFDSSSNNDTVIHDYQFLGNYTVTMYVYDSMNNLCDSFSKSVTIQNYCLTSIDFDYKLDWKTVSFIDKSTSNHYYVKYWEILNSSNNVLKDTTISSANNDTLHYTFQNPGRYYIKLSFYDTFNNSCDTLRVAIDVEPCIASYYIGLDTTQKYKVFIIENSKGITSSTNYLWTFGDGDSSTSRNPTHTYASFGKYELCLRIFDSTTGCNSTFCDTIGLDSNGNFYRSGAFTIVVINDNDLRVKDHDDELLNSIKVYPNPTSGLLSIFLNNKAGEKVSVKVFNLLGQSVLDITQPVNIGDNKFDIDLSYLRDEMYLVRLIIGNEMKTLKVKKVSY